jgi:hypothetical protein
VRNRFLKSEKLRPERLLSGAQPLDFIGAP